MLALLSFLWLAVAVWLGLRAWRQRRALGSLAISEAPSSNTPPISVIIPARNEEQNIAQCLRSITSQRLPDGVLEVVVVDDVSSDRTAELAAEAAAAWPAIRVLRNEKLPAGWKGKPHACWRGAVASDRRSEWLCFLDADVRLDPALLASAIAKASGERIDLLSLAPRHELRSAAERLILPCGHYLLAFAQDLSRMQSSQAREALATGQFMLFRREVYGAIGGHRAVRSAICEDLALACLAKRHGFRVLLLSGDGLLTARMYTGWRTLWPGFAKNLTETFGGVSKTAALATAALVLPWVVFLPAIDGTACANGVNSGCWAIAPALVASCAAIAFHIAGAVHFGIPVFYGFLFPIGYSVGALIALDSVRWRLTGRTHWKGRTYS